MTTPPLDDVEFLARSDHRVEVLRTLASGPRTRPDLNDETGISQPTLGRVLGDFEDRNWVERDGREYGLTPFGELVCGAFEDLLATVETVQELGDLNDLLPTDGMDFDLRELGDATVIAPTDGDAFRHVTRIEELFYGADHVRLLSPTIAPGSAEDRRERLAEFLESDRVNEGIVSVRAMEQEPLFDPTNEDLMRSIREALELERTRFYVYDGQIPLMLMIADGTTILAPTDDRGLPAAVVETGNETVRSWVEAELDEYRARAVAVTVDDLPVGRPERDDTR
jgi:predicted transcriptional regulator